MGNLNQRTLMDVVNDAAALQFRSELDIDAKSHLPELRVLVELSDPLGLIASQLMCSMKSEYVERGKWDRSEISVRLC